MTKIRRPPGRPRTRFEDAPGEHIGFRASRELKEKLIAAATASGRSLSTEAQFRLEQSFRDTGHVLDALPMAFGRELAGLLIGLGQVMKWTGDYARYFVTRKSGADWVTDHDAYNEAKKAAVKFLNNMQPPGEEGAFTKVASEDPDGADDINLWANYHEALLRKTANKNDDELTIRARGLLALLRDKKHRSVK